MTDDPVEDLYFAELEGTAARSEFLTDESLLAPVSDLGLPPAVTLKTTDTIRGAVALMREHRFGCILVEENDRLVGIFTERDVLMKVVGTTVEQDAPLESVMTPNPVALRAEHPIGFALHHMSEAGYRHIPIVDERGFPKHVVSVRDLVAYIAESFPESVKNLPPDPDQTAARRHGG